MKTLVGSINSRSTRKPHQVAMTRGQLLAYLRAESARLSAEYARTGDRPVLTSGLLYDLARTAAHCTRKSITYRGIRFPLLCGWALQVLDPETRRPLVSTGGGFVC
jgi:hypothetical protein